MNWPYELQTGWRYTRAGRGGRRNRFISFISGVSIVGIALGVAALIIVLSVMNGFRKMVQDQMLTAAPHVELRAADGTALADWRATAERARAVALPGGARIDGAAPFVRTPALMSSGDRMQGALLRGISPADEASVTRLAAGAQGPAAARLVAGQWGVVLGSELARELGVGVGDRVSAMLPSGQTTPAGLVPRVRQLVVVGTVESGHDETDRTLALMHLDDAARLLRVDGPTGVELRLNDPDEARAASERLQSALGNAVEVSDWTRANRLWFDAVQVEKRLMFIILSLIVAVAAFNLVATLVMTVTDKRADIAILRTLGASPRSMMAVFMVQGAAAGVMGTLAGVVLGLAAAFHIDAIMSVVERLIGLRFVLAHMPTDPQRGDIVAIVVIALALAFVATLYPSWRASRVQPAQALRYE